MSYRCWNSCANSQLPPVLSATPDRMTAFRNKEITSWSITAITQLTKVSAIFWNMVFRDLEISHMTVDHHANYYWKSSCFFLFPFASAYEVEFLNYKLIQLSQSHEMCTQHCHLHFFLQYLAIIVQSNWFWLSYVLFLFRVPLLHPLVRDS